MNYDFVFAYSLSSQLSTLFFKPLCKTEKSLTFTNVIFNTCPSSGTSTPGMPTLILQDTNGRQFSFDSSEYFIYPTHWSTTSPTQSLAGI